jgi:hypothetical protein
MKILDLSREYKFTDNVQSNLDLLFNMMTIKDLKQQKYSKVVFKIVYNDINIKVKLAKTKSITNGIEFYTLFYKTITNDSILPFKIDYIHPYTLEVKNDCYIVNLHRTENISGSQLMNVMIKLNSILKVQNVYISDGSKVNIGSHDVNLSIMKMIETNKTYYMRFGFNFTLYGMVDYSNKFNNIDDLYKLLHKITKNIRNITVKQINDEYTNLINILNMIDNNNMNKLIIYLKGRPTFVPAFCSKIYKKVVTNDVINDLKKEANTVIDLISKFNYTYIYEILIELFNKRDERYIILNDYVMSSLRYIVKYEEHVIKRKYISWFHILSIIIKDYSYVLKL